MMTVIILHVVEIRLGVVPMLSKESSLPPHTHTRAQVRCTRVNALVAHKLTRHTFASNRSADASLYTMHDNSARSARERV